MEPGQAANGGDFRVLGRADGVRFASILPDGTSDRPGIATIVNHYRQSLSSITIVNHYRPGTAEVGTREEYRRHWQQGTAQQLASNFNPEAPATMIEWMRTQLSEVAQ